MEDNELKRNYSEEELVEMAIKRIKLKRGLYSNIAAFVFVNIFLAFLYHFLEMGNLNDGKPWYLWVTSAWGLGIAFHVFETFQEIRVKLSTNVVDRELERLRKKLEEE